MPELVFLILHPNIIKVLSMITTMEPFRDRVNGATSGSG